MFESHLKHIEMRETTKYKYGKIDEYQSKIKDDVPEGDEGCFKHRRTKL